MERHNGEAFCDVKANVDAAIGREASRMHARQAQLLQSAPLRASTIGNQIRKVDNVLSKFKVTW